MCIPCHLHILDLGIVYSVPFLSSEDIVYSSHVTYIRLGNLCIPHLHILDLRNCVFHHLNLIRLGNCVFHRSYYNWELLSVPPFIKGIVYSTEALCMNNPDYGNCCIPGHITYIRLGAQLCIPPFIRTWESVYSSPFTCIVQTWELCIPPFIKGISSIPAIY